MGRLGSVPQACLGWRRLQLGIGGAAKEAKQGCGQHDWTKAGSSSSSDEAGAGQGRGRSQATATDGASTPATRQCRERMEAWIQEALTMRNRFPAVGARDGAMNGNGRRSLNLCGHGDERKAGQRRDAEAGDPRARRIRVV